MVGPASLYKKEDLYFSQVLKPQGIQLGQIISVVITDDDASNKHENITNSIKYGTDVWALLVILPSRARYVDGITEWATVTK